MNRISQQEGFVDTAMTVAFSPIILGFLIGALPLLLPVLVARGLWRLAHGQNQTA